MKSRLIAVLVAAILGGAAAAVIPWTTPLLTAVPQTSSLLQFDEGGGSWTVDEVAKIPGGTLEGDATWVEGLDGTPAVEFRGDGRMVIDTVGVGDAWTFEAWVMAPPPPSASGFHTLASGLLGNEHIVWCDDGRLGCRVDGTYYLSEQTFPETETRWRLVTAVGTGEFTRIYVDGAVMFEVGVSVWSALCLVGNNEDSSQAFGVVDSVRIFQEALDDGKIQEDVNTHVFEADPRPAALYRLDEGSDQKVANDVPVLCYLTPGCQWTTGITGRAVDFQAAGASMRMNRTLLQPWTLQAWTKFPLPTTTSGSHVLASYNGSSTMFMADAQGFLGMKGQVQFFSSGFNIAAVGTGWHLVTLVGAGGATRFYIDDADVGVAGAAGVPGALVIGNGLPNTQGWGTIDSLRICDAARTAGEIAADAHPAPSLPTTISQVNALTGATIAMGGSAHGDVVIKAKATEALGRGFQLQAQVKPVGSDFDTTGFTTGALAASDTLASVTLHGLPQGGHHWRVRALSTGGSASTWVYFGTNNKNVSDFQVANTVPVATGAAQLRSNGLGLAPGGRVGGGETVHFQVSGSDPDQDAVHAEVEVVPAGSAFQGVPTHVGADLGCDAELGTGVYAWQYRVADAFGGRSAWTSFAGGFEVTAEGSRGSVGCLGSSTGGAGLLLLSLLVGGFALKR